MSRTASSSTGPRASAVALHVLVPLVVGAFVYLAWRTPELRLFRWADALGLGGAVGELRRVAAPARGVVPDWVVFSLPDGLWTYAIGSFLAELWRGALGRARIAWLSFGMSLAIVWELAQAAGWTPGTFDPGDLLAYGMACVACVCVHRGTHEERASARASGRARSVASFAVVCALTLLLVGTSKPPTSAPSSPSTSSGGGSTASGIVPASTNLPAPFDAMGLPVSAAQADAIRFVHPGATAAAIEKEYVVALEAGGWKVDGRPAAGSADPAYLLSRGTDRLALRVRAVPSGVSVSVTLLRPEDAADAGASALDTDAGAQPADAGVESTMHDVVNAARPDLRDCYASELGAHPGRAITTSATVVVGSTGTVTTVTLAPGPARSATFDACVVRVLRALVFPRPPKGAPVTLAVPLVFSP